MTLTLRGIDTALEKCLRKLAQWNGTSLGKAALELMRRGAGLEAAPLRKRAPGSNLRRLAGRMTTADAMAIDRAVMRLRKADLDLQA